jgi:AAHS family 4-hydroxybenzoate transporter-like MFS transporter
LEHAAPEEFLGCEIPKRRSSKRHQHRTHRRLHGAVELAIVGNNGLDDKPTTISGRCRPECSVADTIDAAQLIDGRRIGALQMRTFVLCLLVLFADGFDVQGITYVAPAISADWGLARGALRNTFSAGLFGVMLGAILIAPLADRIGRRAILIGSCVAFGVCTLATVLAGSLATLLPLRVVTGLGLGAAIPNAIALASEYAPKTWRATTVMFVASGISLGAIAAGIAVNRLVAPYGWQAIFVIGGVLPLVLAGVLAFSLPESLRFLAVLPRGQAEAARLVGLLRRDLAIDAGVRVVSSDAEGGAASVRDLFAGERGRATRLLWVAFFMSLLNVYLAINWLPTSLNESGFSVAQAAAITSMYHVGGVLGTYTLGLLMDRIGVHVMLMGGFLLAVCGFGTFALAPGLGAAATTLVLVATGFGVVGGQAGINTLASMVYPVAMRTTGLGWALGVGRVGSIVGPWVGGVMLATGLDARHVYLVCIVPALAAAGSVALLRRRAAGVAQPAAA